MTAWILEIAERVVLRAEGGSPEAEWGLLGGSGVPSDASGVHRTTAGEALARLVSAGISSDAVEAAASAVRKVAAGFARGEAARQMLLELEAAELFDGHVHHAGYGSERRGYEGLVLDMRALADAVGLVAAGTTLQGFALFDWLRRVPADAHVCLFSLVSPGAEASPPTVRWAGFGDVPAIVNALDALEPSPRTAPAPRRAEDLFELLLHKGLSPERLSRIQHSLTVPPPPSAGPLSEPEAWAIELGLGSGELNGALERIETLEKVRGKRPVTVYLRSRALLLLGSEAPRLIAERVESLCATQAFPELSLLAAQAWLAAGEPDRAVPFARAVLLSTQSSRLARDRAGDILRESQPPSARGTTPAGHVALDGDRADAVLSPLDRAWDDGHMRPSTKLAAQIAKVAKASQRIRAAKERPSARMAAASPRRPSRLLIPRPISSRPPALPPHIPAISEPPAEPHSQRTRAWVSSMPESRPPDMAETEPMVPVAHAVSLEMAAAPQEEPIAAPPPLPPLPDETLKMDASVSAPLALITRASVPAQNFVAPSRPTPSAPTRAPSTTPPGTPMRGASMPAFQSDPPPLVDIPRAPRLPRLTPAPAEIAETLSLPPGLHGQIAPLEDELPRTFLEARILFTHMARRLGREYREKHQITLRTTVESIEQMQAVLRDRFRDGSIRTRDDILFVRRHAAFLSEVLARTLEAEWVDIAPTEIGYWAMLVPPKTRVWPFGRVLRLLTRGHRERDLVSYYLELKNRALRERG